MKFDERSPDKTEVLNIASHNIVVDSFGSGDNVLLCLNGGPGLPCDYLREAHSPLADIGYRVVAYDQLGCGRSDKPSDKSLWSIERYVEELEAIRTTLNLGKIHLLGHSWGGWLGIEYGITYPDNLKSLILENTCGDMPHLIQELDRLRDALGSETIKMMLRHEAEGSLDHPEYQAAVTILNHRHVCRLDTWPAPVERSLADWNMEVYGTMQGPNEFLYTGNLKDWNRLAEMQLINCPALITVGMHDELPPSCAMRMSAALPDAKLKVFKNSSHMPFYEEPDQYYETLKSFLGSVVE
jgi:proline iminopeptidase